MAHGKPLDYYCTSEDKPLRFHLLHVDEGLMVLVVFPDNTTMLFDCNVRQDDKDDVIAYLESHIPSRYDFEAKANCKWIDVFVNSHRDQDHYRGLSYVNEAFPIKSIWDSGQTGATTQDDGYQYYMGLRRTLKSKYGNAAVVIPAPSLAPIAAYGMANIYCICSSEEFGTTKFYESAVEELWEERAPKIQHTNCIALLIRYGQRSILLPGDTDWKAWKEKIVPHFAASNLLNTNVLVASHHGSRSFFTDEQFNDSIDPEANPDNTYVESMDYIKPSVVLVPCGDYSSAHHPNKDAKTIYEDYAQNKQVYTTYDKGTFVGAIHPDGRWFVAPTRFADKGVRPTPSFDIRCYVNGGRDPIPSGSRLEIGKTLRFVAIPHGGIGDPDNRVSVHWEVSNGGIRDDHEHQEIYHKGKDEKLHKYEFERDLTYEGTHLLRCRMKNTAKGLDVTKVFSVSGFNPRR